MRVNPGEQKAEDRGIGAMPFLANVYRVMIASPGDVQEERKHVREVISEWNSTYSVSRSITLQPVAWDTDTYPEMGEHPQAIINRQVLNDSDILVGIFCSRLGTPTPNAESGTIEEIERHIATGKDTLLYFSTAPIPRDQKSRDECARVEQFKSRMEGRGLYREYSDAPNFKDQFRRDLSKLMVDAEGSLSRMAAAVVAHDSARSLSPEAQRLLRMASSSQDGRLQHRRLDQAEYYKAGSESFEPSSPRERAEWQSALEELESRDLLKGVASSRAGEIFELTGEGYRMTDELAGDAPCGSS